MPSVINSATSISALGEKIRNISLASLSQSFKKSITTNSTVDDIKLTASENARGQLEINVVEGRNLTIADATKADTYCIVYYEGNITSTLEKDEDELLSSTVPLVFKSNNNEIALLEHLKLW
jgi:hypothetical protein